ncbi:hypothetical protein PMIN02_012085 [Paraphaeosphaeria minitans]
MADTPSNNASPATTTSTDAVPSTKSNPAKRYSVASMNSAAIKSVCSLPGGEARNRHQGPNPYNNPNYRYQPYEIPAGSGSGSGSAAVTDEPEQELPMQYRFPTRTPVAGPYTALPPWHAEIHTWAWWKPAVVSCLACQGCREDKGCCGPNGFCEACDWRCCLSCWCPWWFGGPEHVFLGWGGNGPRTRRREE